MGLFTTDTQVITIGITYLRLGSLVLFGNAILFMTVSLYQGLKQPLFGLVVGVTRQILIPLLLFPFFIYTVSLGLTGAWIAQIVGVVFSAIIVGLLGVRKIKKLRALV